MSSSNNPNNIPSPINTNTATNNTNTNTMSPANNNTNNNNSPANSTLQDVRIDDGNSPRHGGIMHRQVSKIDPVVHKTGIWGASSNLINSIVGAGIIGIPYALQQSGLVVGIALLIVVSYFTDKSLRMIVNLASFHPQLRHLGVLTFEDLMRIPYGNIGEKFILASMFILAYGAMVAYLLIIKDSIPTILGMGNSFVERELIMILVSVTIMVPLSMMRDISQLAYTSLLSVTADVVLVIIVMVYAPVDRRIEEHGGFDQVLSDFWYSGRLFIGLGVLSTAMACQHSAFLISGSLENKTPKRWAAVTKTSLAIAAFLSLLLGVFGFLGFLEDVQGDILNSFSNKGAVVNGGRALLAITMVLTYPMESFVARHVMVQLLFDGKMDNSAGIDSNTGQVIPETKLLGCLGRREKLTFGLYLMTLAPALIVDDLGPVLSLTGSLGASCIAYIAPGLVYLGVNGGDFLDWATGSIRSHKGHSSSGDSNGGGTPPEVELPVVGDATATLPPNPSRNEQIDGGSKPWWWYPTLMPIWVAIASTGERGTREFMNELGIEHQHYGDDEHDDEEEEWMMMMGPRRGDYYMSIIFIVFGAVAAVCGVGTNIYVQVNDIFFVP